MISRNCVLKIWNGIMVEKAERKVSSCVVNTTNYVLIGDLKGKWLFWLKILKINLTELATCKYYWSVMCSCFQYR